MKKLAVAVFASFFLTFSALSYLSSESASAQCAPTNSVTMKQIGSVQKIGNIAIFDLEVKWDMVDQPFVGWLQATTGTIGVTRVTYYPQYFFPDDCSGQLNVKVACQLIGDGPHHVNNQVDLGPAPAAGRTLEPVLIP